MMDGVALQDKISRGLGVAARKLGTPYIVYRPQGVAEPLATPNRVIKLYASFNTQDESYGSVAGYGQALWWGVFDASYTQPGDYLAGAAGSFFIAAQRPNLPVQCVLTNRVVSLLRPSAPVSGGYGGLLRSAAVPLLTGWPGSLLEAGSRPGRDGVAETQFAGFRVLLPQLPQAPRIGDLIVDDLGLNYAVAAAELTDLGWRLEARQIAS